LTGGGKRQNAAERAKQYTYKRGGGERGFFGYYGPGERTAPGQRPKCPNRPENKLQTKKGRKAKLPREIQTFGAKVTLFGPKPWRGGPKYGQVLRTLGGGADVRRLRKKGREWGKQGWVDRKGTGDCVHPSRGVRGRQGGRIRN